MQNWRVVVGVILLLVCFGVQAQVPTNEVTGIGKLTRMMAVGGESQDGKCNLIRQSRWRASKYPRCRHDSPMPN